MCTYIYACNNESKEAMNLKESEEGSMAGWTEDGEVGTMDL